MRSGMFTSFCQHLAAFIVGLECCVTQGSKGRDNARTSIHWSGVDIYIYIHR